MAAKLAASGLDVAVAARGDNRSAIAAGGIRLLEGEGREKRERKYRLRAPKKGEKFPLVLVCVKMFDLKKAAASDHLADDGLMLGIQNGVDAEKVIAEAVGKKRSAAGVAHISASLEGPGLVELKGRLASFFLPPLPPCRELAEAVKPEGFRLEIRKDIASLVWDKFVFLSAFSGATSLFRLPMGEIRSAPALWKFYARAMEEACRVSAVAAPGVLSADCLTKWLAASKKMPDGYRSSMALDLERGKPLELKWLSGKIAELGQKHKIPTPLNRLISDALSPFG